MEGGSGKSGVDDGTDEKLVTQEEGQNEASKDKNEVKYSAEIQNGETKMECDMRRAFVGMGKEELMKFANDPFWVFTRKFLFIMFWIMWAAMLVGSIVIVIYSPKCTSSDKPWFQDSVVYKFDIKAFEHGSLQSRIGDLKALKDHLHYFEYLGVDSIHIGSLMETTDRDRDAVKDFKKIDSSFGSFEILKDLTRRLEKKNIRLTMSFDPNHSSDKHEWFRNSIARIDPYTNFYVWARGSVSWEDSVPIPPNNWRSLTGGSAWSFVKERDQFYLHQFSSHQPDLNYRESKVNDFMKDILQFWLKNGLSGIHLENAKYLVEDSNLGNETINPVNPTPGATHEDYGFYSHTHTTNNPLTFQVIKEWGELVKKQGGVLSVSDFNPENLDLNVVVYHTLKLSNFINATEFDNSVKHNLGRKKPSWQWECDISCPDEITSKALMAIFVLLPGVTIIRGGEELPWLTTTNLPWTSQVVNGTLPNQFDYFIQTSKEEQAKTDSYLNKLKSLIEFRKKDAFRFGDVEHRVLNTTVFTFTRSNPSESYLIAFNFDTSERTVSFSSLTGISAESELTLILNLTGTESTLDEKTQPYVTLPGKTLLVYKFSPISVVSTS